MVNLVQISDAGTKFICDFEMFAMKPYKDSGGLWTIGYGSRITDKQVQQFKDGITQDQAQAMYKDYMQGLTVLLRKCPLAGLQQWQYDAIYSLSYNIGFNEFMNSTIYKRLMVRATDLSPWKWYIRDQHQNVDQGLVRRRELELKLFIYGIYAA